MQQGYDERLDLRAVTFRPVSSGLPRGDGDALSDLELIDQLEGMLPATPSSRATTPQVGGASVAENYLLSI